MHKIKIVYFILCLLLNAAAATSCIDPTDKETVEEGLPAQLHLSLLHQDNIVISRATSPENIENKINNLFVFIFDGTTGKTIFAKFYDKLTPPSLTINTTTGSNRHIYGIANIDLGLMSTTATLLQSVGTEAELKAFAPRLQQEIIARGSSFMMFGFGTTATTEPTAAQDITINTSTNATIWLNRLDAKITFKVKAATNASFTPKEWRVLKVPKTTELVPSAGADKFSAEDANYFDSEWANFEGTGTDMGKTFSFYMLESKVSALKNITDTGATDVQYALREKQEKVSVTPNDPANLPGQTVTNGAFVYAKKNATYVQIKGHLKYEHTGTSGQSTISADVTYTIHLGYLKNNLNDYTSLRNTNYTYTITVESASKIITEVTDNTESQPGAEGDVAYATQLHAVDANNEITSVTFNRNNIAADKITWDVKTPFSKGTQKENPKDFDWVKFSLNTKTNNIYTDDFISYPGDKEYTAGSIDYATYCNATSKPLLDVDQLVSILKAVKTDPNSPLFDTKGNIKFTAYINEYYYTKDPLTNAPASVTLWKRFVNQPDRVLNIVTGSKYSSDGGSMVSNAIQSFRQSSIQTVYNVNSPSLKTAWGSEMTQDEIIAGQELGNFPTTANSSSDGRANTLTLWGITETSTKKWSDFIDQTKWKQITSSTAPLVKPKLVNACMLKNRDRNGDGIINKNEVMWYLASLNQLTDIWIGESSLSLPTKLYTQTWTTIANNIWHISSTVQSANNPMLIWSMEGSSTGNANGTESPKEAGYMYRCVRNLGTTGDTAPDELIVYNSTTKEMDLSNLNPKSIRAYTQQAELQPHHERSAENMPWKKFEIQATNSGSDYNWIRLNDAVNNGTSPCASIAGDKKWRVPNQRELAIMLSLMSDIASVISRTSYSFSAANREKPGFSVAGSGFMTVSSSVNGGTRCVRDIP